MIYKEKNVTKVDWQFLTMEAQLDQIVDESEEHLVLIFKHSTRCNISSMALDRLERGWSDEDGLFKPYFLDLLAYRNISEAIAEKFKVIHQSPQVIVIRSGKAVYHTSHLDISFQNLQRVH